MIEKEMSYKALNAKSATADGNPQQILGKLKVDIEYGNVRKSLDHYIVLSLKQDLYLGIDFCRLYNLLPKQLQVAAKESGEISEDGSKGNDGSHNLSEREKMKLSA